MLFFLVLVAQKECQMIQRRWKPFKSEVRCIHNLASFYRRLVKDFNTLAAPLNEIIKKNGVFKWSDQQEKALTALKEKFTNSLVLALPNFVKSFEFECDPS